MTDKSLIPIFLLSLPRSGSTLAQRILAAHDGVATASEPWLLLPWLSPLEGELPDDGRWHRSIYEAVQDFSAELPGGVDDYREAVHDAAMRLYRRSAGPHARFFVDKTPPYSMIVDQIAATFPEGRLVFLWRNPLAVTASVVETLAGGHWRPSDYPVSLFSGAAQLVDSYRRHQDRAVAVRYEDLLTGETGSWRALCSYCGFEFEPQALESFASVELKGRMGDPVGRAPRRLSLESREKWKGVVSTPIRKAWCRRYLRWLGPERLATMGYDLEALMADLDAVPADGGSVLADALDSASSLARAAIKAQLRTGGGTSAAWRAVLGS